MAPDGPVLAVDPGRGKCGLAVVRRPNVVLAQSVVPREELLHAVSALVEVHRPVALVVGDRTGSRDACRELRSVAACPIVTVPEHETTLRARARYFQDHPPRGLAALVPPGLRTPPRPVDDYAAILLGEAYWRAEGPGHLP